MLIKSFRLRPSGDDSVVFVDERTSVLVYSLPCVHCPYDAKKQKGSKFHRDMYRGGRAIWRDVVEVLNTLVFSAVL